MDLGIKGKTAIVCAASKGLGKGCASALAQEGVDVTICARTADVLNATADEIRSQTGVKVTAIACDITTDAGRAEVLAACPNPDILVNNAGGPPPGTFKDYSLDDWRKAVEANMITPIALIHATVFGMMDRGFGRIVNIASRAHLGKTLRTSYAATKGAMVSLTKVWALELAPHGISVNAIAPGPIRTALFERANPPDNPRTQQILDAIPVGRFGEPEDVANGVGFFIDQRSGFVTGQVLYVCGGVTLVRGGS